jgi:hypothetical protein
MEADNPSNKCLSQLLSCLTLIFPNLLKGATVPANQTGYHDPADPATVRGHNPQMRKHKKKKYQKVDNPQNSVITSLASYTTTTIG